LIEVQWFETEWHMSEADAAQGEDVRLELTDWAHAAERAMPLRMQVFVLEQGVPADLERDEFDPLSLHALASTVQGQVVGTGRLLPDGHIGRMAVDAKWRGRGIGGRVLKGLVAAARARGMPCVVLNAQVQAMAFYRRHGFVAFGEHFVEAGLMHCAMRCDLAEPQ
jgi:predicted GNAT family N-acyltransferase